MSEITLIEYGARVAPLRTTMRLARPSLPRIAPMDPRLAEPDSARAGGFRLLRDNVLAKGLPRVLAITSALPHEGKTTCAANLALAIAEQVTRRIVLFDANFFAPSLATIFGVADHARLVSLAPRLDLATVARGERLDRGRMIDLLNTLFRTGYDHVVVDAPCVDPIVAQLLDVADGVLFTTRAGKSTRRTLRSAMERIAPSKHLGVALC